MNTTACGLMMINIGLSQYWAVKRTGSAAAAKSCVQTITSDLGPDFFTSLISTVAMFRISPIGLNKPYRA